MNDYYYNSYKAARVQDAQREAEEKKRREEDDERRKKAEAESNLLAQVAVTAAIIASCD